MLGDEVNIPFTAMLLAGGRSSRMGTDKARLVFRGEPLWRRQLATLVALGPKEILISAGSGGAFEESGCRVVPDLVRGAGPLAGVAACAAAMASEWLLVLAVDMPAMNAAFLERILSRAAAEGRGVVPLSQDRFQPLAAIYPRWIGPLAIRLLEQGQYSMQHFVRSAIAEGFAAPFDLPDAELAHFANINTPSDLDAALAGERAV